MSAKIMLAAGERAVNEYMDCEAGDARNLARDVLIVALRARADALRERNNGQPTPETVRLLALVKAIAAEP
mgnify:CR=1 FL=1